MARRSLLGHENSSLHRWLDASAMTRSLGGGFERASVAFRTTGIIGHSLDGAPLATSGPERAAAQTRHSGVR